MTQHKYLSDGRKVVVIGNINKTEYIVQEVFVTEDGSEIPSGENFTAKSLLDEPAKSWKQKEAEKYDKLYDDRKSELNTLEKELKQLKEKRKAYSDMLQANEKFVELFQGADTSFLADVVTGNIEYVAYDLRVTKFDDSVYQWDNYWGDKRYEGIKMVSVFACNASRSGDDKFKIMVNDYRDGSGGEQTPKFFRNLQELQEYLHEQVEVRFKANTLRLSDIKLVKPYISVSNEIIEELIIIEREKAEANYQDSVKRAKNMLDKQIGEIEDKV